jgi:hypothetical protein
MNSPDARIIYVLLGLLVATLLSMPAAWSFAMALLDTAG